MLSQHPGLDVSLMWGILGPEGWGAVALPPSHSMPGPPPATMKTTEPAPRRGQTGRVGTASPLVKNCCLGQPRRTSHFPTPRESERAGSLQEQSGPAL